VEIFLLLGMVGILTELVRAIPISLQGIGIRERVFAFLLTEYGGSFDQAFVLGAEFILLLVFLYWWLEQSGSYSLQPMRMHS